MKKRKPTTAAGQLTKLFISLFVTILIIVNLIFIATATNLIYRYADDQAEEVTETIENDWAPSKDWTPLLTAYVARQDDDAIAIASGQRHYYSPKAPRIFGQINHRGWSINNLRVTHEGVYYLRQQNIHGSLVRVAINVDDLLSLTAWLLGLTILINLATIIFAIPLIRRLAHRWTTPLTRLNQDINAVNPQGAQPQSLTVPDQPLEVKNVAESFNDLLDHQYQAMQREKAFVANASHELKTPLAGILGHVNLIKRHGKQHPELVDKSLGYIDQEAQRMQRMINELLTLEGHQSQGPLAATNLVPIINDEVASIRGAYQREFKFNAPAELSYKITASDFQSLAHNLLENAAKYSPTGSLIDISLKQNDNGVSFQVADQGGGIAPENRQRIFDRFYREDESHSSTVPGSGIGLAIVKAIVDKYQGQITVSDNQPCGTVFTVSLPHKKWRFLHLTFTDFWLFFSTCPVK